MPAPAIHVATRATLRWGSTPWQSVGYDARYVGGIVLLALLYFASARLGLSLAFTTTQVTAIWPPAGVGLLALLLFGTRIWPGIYLGAFLANALATEPLMVAASVAFGNTLAGLAGAAMLRRLGFQGALERARDVLALMLVSISSTLISTFWGTQSLEWGGLIPASRGFSVGWTWWVGESLGVLLVMPCLLTWVLDPRLRLRPWRRLELACWAAVTFYLSWVIFAQFSSESAALYRRSYLAFPLLIWTALRFGQKFTVLGALMLCVLAVWGSIHGVGPFSRGSPDDRLVSLDTFIAAVECTALLLGAATAERRGAERALQKSEAMLQAVIDSTPAAVYVKDLDGRYQLINRLAKQMMPGSVSEVLGKTDYELFAREDADRFRGMDRRVIHSGETLSEEQLIPDQGSAPRTFISAKSPIRNPRGEIYAVVGVSTDITERYEAQERLRRAHDELEQRVQERTAELVKSNREKETLLREIHHRVKNNLQVVSSLLNLQAHGLHEPRLAAFVQESRDRIRSMALVHEHLYQSPSLDSVDMPAYLKALTDSLAQALIVHQAVECRVEAEPVTLPVDQAIPCGLLVNELATNALKHAFPAGRAGALRIAIGERADGAIELVVADDGIGLATPVPATESGFGMRLVSLLAGQLGASMQLERAAGTTFRFQFVRSGAA